jgi:ABC-type polysaccharide/polyol phosphate transport system ATPase subunit
MPDCFVSLEDVTLRFRLYSTNSRSIKESALNLLLRRKYGKPASEITALNGVSLHIPHGQRLGIIGDNGAGKSTLLKVICRIYPPTRGRVRRQGFTVPLLEVGIGFNYELSGLENIYLTGAIMGFSRREMARRVQPILQFAELQDFGDTPIKYYSSGMAQRLAFSVATQIDPEILLLDEIFSAGDIHWMEKAERRMRGLIDRTAILVLVSHQMNLIRQYCNHVIWMQAGRIVKQGPPDEVVTAYQSASAT